MSCFSDFFLGVNVFFFSFYFSIVLFQWINFFFQSDFLPFGLFSIDFFSPVVFLKKKIPIGFLFQYVFQRVFFSIVFFPWTVFVSGLFFSNTFFFFQDTFKKIGSETSFRRLFLFFSRILFFFFRRFSFLRSTRWIGSSWKKCHSRLWKRHAVHTEGETLKATDTTDCKQAHNSACFGKICVLWRDARFSFKHVFCGVVVSVVFFFKKKTVFSAVFIQSAFYFQSFFSSGFSLVFFFFSGVVPSGRSFCEQWGFLIFQWGVICFFHNILFVSMWFYLFLFLFVLSLIFFVRPFFFSSGLFFQYFFFSELFFKSFFFNVFFRRFFASVLFQHFFLNRFFLDFCSPPDGSEVFHMFFQWASVFFNGNVFVSGLLFFKKACFLSSVFQLFFCMCFFHCFSKFFQ